MLNPKLVKCVGEFGSITMNQFVNAIGPEAALCCAIPSSEGVILDKNEVAVPNTILTDKKHIYKVDEVATKMFGEMIRVSSFGWPLRPDIPMVCVELNPEFTNYGNIHYLRRLKYIADSLGDYCSYFTYVDCSNTDMDKMTLRLPNEMAKPYHLKDKADRMERAQEMLKENGVWYATFVDGEPVESDIQLVLI